MTIYIFGGSNAATKQGWADNLASRVLRKAPVQIMALGATNSLTSMSRILSEVDLCKDDVIVWSNATNDALCMCGAAYPEALFLEVVEGIIIACRNAGARFVPVLIDTFNKHLSQGQPQFEAGLKRLFDHYQLEYLDLADQFRAETGQPDIPQNQFKDPLHIGPQAEISDFLAGLCVELIALGRGYPAEKKPLFLPPRTEFKIVSHFAPEGQQDTYQSFMIETSAWCPPLQSRDVERAAELVALTVVADPSNGRFVLRAGGQIVRLSVNHLFANSGHGVVFSDRNIVLSICIRTVLPQGLFLKPGDRIEVDWDHGTDPIETDMYFRPTPRLPDAKSEARLISALLREQG